MFKFKYKNLFLLLGLLIMQVFLFFMKTIEFYYLLPMKPLPSYPYILIFWNEQNYYDDFCNRRRVYILCMEFLISAKNCFRIFFIFQYKNKKNRGNIFIIAYFTRATNISSKKRMWKSRPKHFHIKFYKKTWRTYSMENKQVV